MANNNVISSISNNIPIYLCNNVMCRLCGCTGNNLSYILLKETCYLVKMIKIETNIQIKENDIYPRTVCRGCIDKIKLIKHFKTHCKKTQRVLQEMYKDKNINDIETEDDMIVEWLEDDNTNHLLINEQIDKNPVENSTINNYSIMYNDVNTFQNVHITVQEQNLPNNATIVPPKLLGQIQRPRIKVISQDKQESKIENNAYLKLNESDITGPLLYRLLTVDSKKIYENSDKSNIKPTLNINNELKREIDVKTDKRIDRSGRTFITNSHKYVKRISEKKYSCMICNATFRFPFQVELHIRRHTGELPFTCKTCGKSFITGFYLLKHEKVHKTGQYICEICGKDFRQYYSLRDHQRIHTDSSPSFNCEHCGKEYYSKINFDAHKLIHAEKKHVCEICGKQFSLHAMMKRHQSRHQNHKFYC